MVIVVVVWPAVAVATTWPSAATLASSTPAGSSRIGPTTSGILVTVPARSRVRWPSAPRILVVVVPAIAPRSSEIVVVVVVGVPAAIKTVARVPVEIVVAIKIVEGIVSVRIICGESAGRALDALKGNVENTSVMASGTGSTEITSTIEFVLDTVSQVCQVPVTKKYDDYK